MRFHRLRTAMPALKLCMALASAPVWAQPAPGAQAAAPRVEIDRGVLAIDVASQRRALDASIQRALERRAVPSGVAPDIQLATAAGRERG